MSKQFTLSLPSVVLINTNIMMGTGLFVNTVILSKYSGALGAGLYLMAGLLMLPLVLCMAQQTKHHAEGNFYSFGNSLSSLWGFLSTWVYFISKLASATLGIHVFSLFLIDLFPTLSHYPLLWFEVALIGLFVLLNTLNVKTGKSIQVAFVLMKSIPLLFAIIAGLITFNMIHISAPHIIWAGIPAALPLTLFCCLGFEATCSLSRHLKNPQIDGPRAIVISFLLVIFIATLYQFLFYGSLGTWLSEQTNYVDAFEPLIKSTIPQLLYILNPLFSLAIGTSALGGSYGILYSNSWNLFILAQKNHLIGSSYFSKLNTHNIPILCVIAEGFICILYLLITKGSQVPLQYTAVLGCITAYAISTLALYHDRKTFISMLGLATCVILATVCLNGFIHTSFTPLIIFGTILLTGFGMFYSKQA
jgi:amino acid transporter